MRVLISLALVLAAVVLTGAFAAYPLYLVTSAFTPVRFEKIISHATIASGLIFSLVYLRAVAGLSLESIGLRAGRRALLAQLPAALAAGVLLIALFEASLLLFGLQRPDHGADLSAGAIAVVAGKALLSGLLVALVEEILFRGALYGALQRQGGAAAAVLLSSAVFTLAHFLKYPAPPATDSLGWFTGIYLFWPALGWLRNPVFVDSVVTFFMLGLLLAVIRWRCGHIIQCIGLHAGIVAALKTTKYVFEHVPGAGFAFLVNRHENYQGWLTSAWLALGILLYLVLSRRRQTG